MVGLGQRRPVARSSAPDTDLAGDPERGAARRQGDLRAERAGSGPATRKLDEARSTALQPLQTHARADAAPLPARPVHPGAGGDLPVRPRLPGRQQDPHHHQRPGRRRADLGFDTLPAPRTNSVARSAGRPRRWCSRWSPASPCPRRCRPVRPPGPALPHLRRPGAVVVRSTSFAERSLSRRCRKGG